MHLWTTCLWQRRKTIQWIKYSLFNSGAGKTGQLCGKNETKTLSNIICCCSLVTQWCLNFCDPVDCSMTGFQTHVHWVGDAIQPSHSLSLHHLILCHSLLLLASVFPRIRVFSNESAVRVRWPEYWSFRFSISSSNKYSGQISFRMDWLDLLAVQGTHKSLL